MIKWLPHVLGAIVVALIAFEFVIQFFGNISVAISNLTFDVFLLVTAVVGWFLAWRRPRHPIAWLLLVVPALFVVPTAFWYLAGPVQSIDPGAVEWFDWLGDNAVAWIWVAPIGLLFAQIPLRFPTGSLPSSRWRWFSWVTIAAIVFAAAVFSTAEAKVAPGVANPVYVPWGSFGLETAEQGVPMFILLSCFVASIASLFIRYRRATAVERAQLRWMFWAVCIPVALLVPGWVIPGVPYVVSELTLLTYALIPISIAVAVLRYGLFGIDRIISRTVSYAIVTIVIVGVYVGIVLGIGALLPQAGSVGIAIATLAAAAVFFPLLRVVQRLVDRRFNRAAYNAQRVVEAFGERLRSGADPHATASDLANAVGETLQPSSLGIWTIGDAQ